MATVLENLETTQANIAAILVQITTNPKPTYSIDGQSVSWESYFKTLTDQLKAINELIAVQSGPFEYRTQAVS